MMRRVFFLIPMCIIISIFSSYVMGEEKSSAAPFKVTKEDKCPVCGMFVHKNPNWVAQIIFIDKTSAFFDGPKDMFKYYFDLKKYNQRKTTKDVDSLWVTDYYTTKLINGKKAFYVVGGDVLGPMGHDLVPHKSEKAARYFLKDHGGKQVLRFEEIDLDLVETLR
jgi:nitrous oxide reductase accessory protein NosL